MFQFAFVAVLFKFTYAPQFAPLLQFPPTRAQTAPDTRKHEKNPVLRCYSDLLRMRGKFTAAPQYAPLLQTPPTRATATIVMLM